jgi:hypothetical protein
MERREQHDRFDCAAEKGMQVFFENSTSHDGDQKAFATFEQRITGRL